VRLLIDTHILLWADQRPRLITARLRGDARGRASSFDKEPTYLQMAFDQVDSYLTPTGALYPRG
jgi:hypothetical protein